MENLKVLVPAPDTVPLMAPNPNNHGNQARTPDPNQTDVKQPYSEESISSPPLPLIKQGNISNRIIEFILRVRLHINLVMGSHLALTVRKVLNIGIANIWT